MLEGDAAEDGTSSVSSMLEGDAAEDGTSGFTSVLEDGTKLLSLPENDAANIDFCEGLADLARLLANLVCLPRVPRVPPSCSIFVALYV